MATAGLTLRHAIRSTVPLPVPADGDVIGSTPVVVELLPHAVRVLVPEGPMSVPALAQQRGDSET